MDKMTKEEFQDWKAHPQTQQFLQFLKDYQKWVEVKWLEQVKTRSNLKTQENSLLDEGMRAKLECLNDIVELEADFIVDFYEGN